MTSTSFDILLPVYNPTVEALSLTLDSVFKQSHKNYNVIIVNDGSDKYLTEYLKSILASKHGDKIRIINNEKNQGITYSLNKGLGACESVYIARIDAGDTWYKDKLSTAASYLADCDFFYHRTNRYDCSTKRYSSDAFKPHYLLDLVLPRYNPITHSAASWRRKLNIKYDENYLTAQDYELWCRLAISGIKIASTSRILGTNEIDSNSISRLRAPEQINSAQQIRKSMRELNKFSSEKNRTLGNYTFKMQLIRFIYTLKSQLG
jgi:glycosyltransferase involved in cell wall biosynthesis